MPSQVTREEFAELADEVAGEKIVTRHVLEQTRRNGDDLAAVKTRLGRVEEKVDRIERRVVGIEGKVDGLEGKVDGLEGKVDGLVKELPRMIAETMREVFAERDKRR